MNKYFEKLQFVKSEVTAYLKEIFKVYGDELLLILEDYNLLSSDNNCIETSTAMGFILEEFITSKLEIYSKNHDNISKVKIEKIQNCSTITKSYDCYVNYDGVFFLINIKVQKEGSNNNAVAAINILHNDYVSTNPNQEKSYVVIKTKYKYGVSAIDNQRKILIQGIEIYCLEEIDFTSGHRQDHRNWSKEFKVSSGRLQISNADRVNKLLSQEKISYQTTKQFIDDIYNEKN